MKNIIKDATVIYMDGIMEYFDAIRITNNGVFIGKIINNEFESYGFIPKQSIKQINNGNNERISP